MTFLIVLPKMIGGNSNKSLQKINDKIQKTNKYMVAFSFFDTVFKITPNWY